ncbi:hypothetical protein BT96DRAFT_976033 [Gymnopus androsaceus JB14]|uniref:Uncharacterized protein n=1 Tax=Gymnopus androsaceus JB14 TaxID=1447944 RepID=A0A6A4HLC5_9AGAR|nr:hypothetical protein BT96DRAFT_976033 [Gymnopus androsaceus JB14]
MSSHFPTSTSTKLPPNALNYFDSDISLDSRNAILLTAPKTPGDDWVYDDNGVKQDFTCIPQQPKPFEYSAFRTYDAEGNLAKPETVEEMRKVAELYHRVKVEL